MGGCEGGYLFGESGVTTRAPIAMGWPSLSCEERRYSQSAVNQHTISASEYAGKATHSFVAENGLFESQEIRERQEHVKYLLPNLILMLPEERKDHMPPM